jgi:hypothetical protein
VIGAAWLYLLELHPELAKPAEDAAGTIFYPFHGWEGQHVLGDHGRIVASINEHEKGPVTVCLYWNEYGNATSGASTRTPASASSPTATARCTGATPTRTSC